MRASPFVDDLQPDRGVAFRETLIAADYGDPAREHHTATTGAAVVDRSWRGRLVVSGADRKTWLHGLVTNAVSTLDDGAGNYAFAIDARGRVQFDLNILALPEALWLDVDRVVARSAAAHLDRYLFQERAAIADASDDDARIGCAGPLAGRIAAAIGVANFQAMPSLGHVALGDARFVRHDFAGPPGFELIVPRAGATPWRRTLLDAGAAPCGLTAIEAVRIEHGIPLLGLDIDETVLPPETGQIERGISYVKGCYTGYEIMERMRSRGGLARRLARLRVSDGRGLATPAALMLGVREAGRLTSLAQRPGTEEWVGLGYVRTNVDAGEGLSAGAARVWVLD